MTKEEKNKFLNDGGVLIRRGVRAGKQVIRQRTQEKDWHNHSAYPNALLRDQSFDELLSDKYIADE